MIIILVPITFLLLVIFLVLLPEKYTITPTDFSQSMNEAEKDYNSRMYSTIEFQKILDRHFIGMNIESQSATSKVFERKDIYAEWEKRGWITFPQSPRPDSSIESC